MSHPSLNSILLASSDPERLHAWYVAALDPEEDTKADHYRILRFGAVVVVIDTRADIGPTSPEPGRIIFNFDVDDARAVVARMEGLGVSWLAPIEDRDGSLWATAIDPDGNYVQIIQSSTAEKDRFANARAYSGFSVNDLDAAKSFYGEILGLTVTEIPAGLTLRLAGDRNILVYPKPNHQPATYTILNFPVTDVESAVDDLTKRGVRFERYEGMDQDGQGIVRSGGPLIAWFTDPAGNIISVIEE